MQFKSLEELLSSTCNRISFIDSFNKSPCENLLVSMYDAVGLDFKENYKLLRLVLDYKIEKKQLRYMLRKTKKLRKQSWKMSYGQLSEEYKKDKINMYAFDYQAVENLVNTFKIFDARKEALRQKKKHRRNIFSIFKRKKKANIVCFEKESGNSSETSKD